MNKRCSACKKDKPEKEFAKNSTKSGGLQDKCKKCQKDYFDGWRKKNPDWHAKWYKNRKNS